MNTKLLTIDCDQATAIVAPQNGINVNINFTRGNIYILQANCYSNSASTNVASFDVSDSWYLYIGRQYQSNAAPVVSITDPAAFNSASDWPQVDVSNGAICARVNVISAALTTDLGNTASQNYTLQWINTNDAGKDVMICDTTCIITNAVQL